MKRRFAARPRSFYKLLPLVAAPLSFLGPLQASANPDTWNVVSGNWSTPGSWNPAAVPIAGDTVNITPADGLNRNITYDYTGPSITLSSLTLNRFPSGLASNTTTFLMSANSLTVTTEKIASGNAGSSAAFSQSGGTNSAGNLYLGDLAGDTGNYSLNNSAALSISSALLVVGNNGTGNVNQSNTTSVAISSGQLVLGYFTGSAGNYFLNNSASLVDGGNETIGYSGTGTFTQTGGTNHVVNFQLFLGYFPGITGNYSMSNLTGASALTADLGEVVGFSGNGIFTQSAGTNTTPNLTLGLNSGAGGVYNITGGNLNVAGTISLGGSASGGASQLTVNGGSVVVGTLKFWNSNCLLVMAAGSLTVSNLDTSGLSNRIAWVGGTLTIPGLLVQPTGPLGGSVAIGSSQQLISTGDVVMGAINFANTSGTINQFGGTVTLQTSITVGYGGGTGPSLYHLSGGSLTVTNEIDIAQGSIGSFTQTGGTASAFNVTVGQTAGGNGLLSLNDPSGTASFTATNFLYVGGNFNGPGSPAALIITHGTVNAGGLVIYNSTGSVTLNGGTLSTSSVHLSDTSNFIWSSGTLIMPAISIDSNFFLGASLNVYSNMTLSSTFGLTNNGTLAVAGGTVRGGTFIVNNANFEIFGTLAGSGGVTNNGNFIHADGNLNITNAGVFINLANMQLANGFQLALSGGNLSNSGFLDLNNSTVTGTATLVNNIDGTISGSGIIQSPFSNAGLLVLDSGLLKLPTFTNAGVVELSGPSATLGIAANTLTNSATIEGHGKISMAINNNATIEATGGTLILSGALTNGALASTLRAATGNKILITGPFSTNLGILSLAGGTIDTSNQVLVNFGQISGFGVLATGGLINESVITFTGGSTIINGPVTNSFSIVIKDQPALFTGLVTNNSGATIKSTSTVATFAGGYTGSGTFTSDPSVNSFQSTVAISSGGSMTGSTGDQFLFNSGSVSNAGTFHNGGLLQSSENISNSGTFIQSGPQSWSPATTFSNTAGSATFSTDPGSTNARNLSLAITGGTVKLTGPQHLQSLSLASGSLDVSGDIFLASANFSSLAASITSHAIFTSSTIPGAVPALLSGTDFLAVQPSGQRHGQTVLPSDTLLTLAYGGDSNLDGKINIDDYLTIDYAFTHHLTGTKWINGDTNLNGSIDAFDYAAIDTAFRLQSGTLADAEIALHTAQFGQPYLDALATLNPTPIPEPASLLLLAIAAPFLIRKRTARTFRSKAMGPTR